MKKSLAAFLLTVVTAQASATAIYNWESTSTFVPDAYTIDADDMFSLNVSWTISDAAVARGYIQLISDGSGSTPPTPEDIIDFRMSATNSDGSKTFSWDKSDLPIKFDRPNSTDEAFDTNFYLNGGVPSIGDIWGMMKKDSYWFNGQGDVFEANLPDGSVYALFGQWTQTTRTSDVPEPNSLLLLLAGFAGIAIQRRRTNRSSNASSVNAPTWGTAAA